MGKKNIMDYVFKPSSIAVIGASSDEKREKSTGWVGKLLEFGYGGKIYPINPNVKKILGLKAYPSLREVPESIDYTIISIPRDLVPDALKDCVAKDIKIAHIYSAGFKETNERRGLELQEEVKEIIRGKKIRVIGPNCMGVYSPSVGLTFDTRFPKETGSIAFISQTGVGGRRFLYLASGRGLRFRMAVSYGNGIDLNVTDFLEHAYADPKTEVSFIYLEGLREGQRFFHTLRECTKVKPVVILKAGLSESGAGAVGSHTASLCGTKKVWEALFKQTGAIHVESLEEAVDLLVGIRMIPEIKGRNIGLVGRGGGIGVISADMCEKEGLKVPQLSNETKERLAKIVAVTAGSGIRNPVEIGLGVDGVSEHYVEGLEIVASDPEVDFIITFINPEDYIHYGIQGWVDDLSRALIEAKKRIKKPFCFVILQGPSIEIFKVTLELQKKCQKENIASFTSMGSAIRTVSKIVAYHEFVGMRFKVSDFDYGDASVEGHKIISKIRSEGRKILTEIESKRLIGQADVKMVETELAKNKDEVVSISERMGFPVALKIISPDVVHKTDSGGVRLGISTKEEVVESYEQILRNIKWKYPHARIDGLSVQKMAPPGLEIVVGVFKDEQFGPVVMFGLGGILVEILEDVSFRITPINKKDALLMMREVKGYPLLEGFRGKEGVDIPSLEDLLVGMSDFAQAYPEIREIDLNPVFAYKDGYLAVDARVILHGD